MPSMLRVIKMGALLLGVALIIAACGGGDTPVEPQAPIVEVVSVETAIAQTIESQAAVEAIVAQTVAAQLAAQEPAADPVEPPPAQDPAPPTVDPNAPDVVDPNSGIEPIKPVADPNVAAGTPQLKIIYSSVNVRIGPGTNCRAVSALLKDSVVPVKSRNQDGKWFEVTMPNGQNGWVADSVSDLVVAADIANVPVSSTPYCAPPPTPTATKTPLPTKTALPTATILPTNTVAAPGNTPMPTNTKAAPANTPIPTNTIAAPVNTPTMTNTPEPPPTATDEPVAIPSNVDFLNNTNTDIWALFIDLSSVGPTSDLLGGNPLLPTESIVVNLPGGTYDIIALDASNNVVCDYYNVQISGYVLWDCN